VGERSSKALAGLVEQGLILSFWTLLRAASKKMYDNADHMSTAALVSYNTIGRSSPAMHVSRARSSDGLHIQGILDRIYIYT
jgi:hypothetical protein